MKYAEIYHTENYHTISFIKIDIDIDINTNIILILHIDGYLNELQINHELQ